jgi:hypothetical protein
MLCVGATKWTRSCCNPMAQELVLRLWFKPLVHADLVPIDEVITWDLENFVTISPRLGHLCRCRPVLLNCRKPVRTRCSDPSYFLNL